MGADACGARRRRVVADEEGRSERRVDAFHHAERARERTDERDGNVGRELLEQQ